MIETALDSNSFTVKDSFEVNSVVKFLAILSDANHQPARVDILVRKLFEALKKKPDIQFQFDTLALLSGLDQKFQIDGTQFLTAKLLAACDTQAPRPELIAQIVERLLSSNTGLATSLKPALDLIYDCASSCPSSFALDVSAHEAVLRRLLPAFTPDQRADLRPLLDDIAALAGPGRPHQAYADIVLDKPL